MGTLSAVRICNRALQKVGARRIASLDDDSREARAVKNCYESLRDEELEANAWRFSIIRAQLSVDATTPPFGRSYRYAIPDDWIAPAPLDPQLSDSPTDFLYEGGFIYTNYTSPLNVRYVSNAVSESLWSPLFAGALGARIAMEIVEELTQSGSKKTNLEAGYSYFISLARRRNAMISGPTRPEIDDWETTRS